MRLAVAIVICLAASPAMAQQAAPPPDAAELARRLAVVEAQRTVILGWHTASEAARAALADELAKANAEIKDLKAKPDPSKQNE